MDASPDVLAAAVRAKRVAVDNDLELLRVRMQKMDPRRVDTRRWTKAAWPFVAGSAAAYWLWRRHRRSMKSLKDLLISEVRELYGLERQLLGALDRMAATATHPELRMAFEQHRHESEMHLHRLERVFRAIGSRPSGGDSMALAGILGEGERLLNARIDPDVRDACLIATAQQVEHVEMAAYGTARAFAETLGHTDAAQLLQQTLEEERATDQKLTRLAERFVNPQAVHTAPA